MTVVWNLEGPLKLSFSVCCGSYINFCETIYENHIAKKYRTSIKSNFTITKSVKK